MSDGLCQDGCASDCRVSYDYVLYGSVSDVYVLYGSVSDVYVQGYIGIVAHQDQTWVEVTLPSSSKEIIATFKGQMYSPEMVIRVMQYTPSPPFMLLVTPLEHYGQSAQVPTVIIETGALQESSIKLLTSTCHINSITSMSYSILCSDIHCQLHIVTPDEVGEVGNNRVLLRQRGHSDQLSRAFHGIDAGSEAESHCSTKLEVEGKDVLSTEPPYNQVYVFSHLDDFSMYIRDKTMHIRLYPRGDAKERHLSPVRRELAVSTPEIGAWGSNLHL
ncbi:hypothetical protein Btru_061158 [Bulinus truncatus]|nr:hypothetical protein Btru_061158 [Bulinus truncatus]